MKKILICLAVALVLTNCEIRVKPATAQEFSPGGLNCPVYQYHEEVHANMKFGVFLAIGRMPESGSAIQVINLTKEETELQLLRKQIANIK